jgi:hypothetical protein
MVDMMFPFIPPLRKNYVVIGIFEDRDWYLADANPGHKHHIMIRKWTSNGSKAIKFSNKEDAESIALLVCDGDIAYKIGGIPAV